MLGSRALSNRLPFMISDGSSAWFQLLSTLILAGIVLTGLGASVPITNFPSQPPHSASPQAQNIDTLRVVSRDLFRLTNQKRTQRGLDSLTEERQLRRIACEHSRDMLDRDFIRHENPDGNGPADRVAKHHRRLIGGVGENLWSQTGRETVEPRALAEETFNRWMRSSPHRKNILRSRFSHLGVCTLQRGEQIRGAQVFARARAYLQDPLPYTAPVGETLVAPIERTFPRDAVIAKYDYWDPDKEEQIASPLLFADTLQLPETTGSYRLRFYVPQANRYQIHWGPELRITSSP